MVVVHIRILGDGSSLVRTACGVTAFGRASSPSTVTEALAAAAEMGGRVCAACLRAHGFEVTAPDDAEHEHEDDDDDRDQPARLLLN